MNTHLGSWLSRRKGMLVAVSLPILVAAWWAFRPEKLWINQTVSEPAPSRFEQRPSAALYTGRWKERRTKQAVGQRSTRHPMANSIFA